MSYLALPRALSPGAVRIGTEHHTQVFSALCRLLTTWRDDPERLAMALAAWTLFGFPYANASMDVAKGTPAFTEDEALERMEAALFRKNAKVLRAKGYGLLMALVEFAPAVERDRLHAARLDAGVIDCRPREERLRG